MSADEKRVRFATLRQWKWALFDGTVEPEGLQRHKFDLRTRLRICTPMWWFRARNRFMLDHHACGCSTYKFGRRKGKVCGMDPSCPEHGLAARFLHSRKATNDQDP